jgi:hypothetical protein
MEGAAPAAPLCNQLAEPSSIHSDAAHWPVATDVGWGLTGVTSRAPLRQQACCPEFR